MKIFNFCIIAHIDHGKSTLSDRLIEMTGTVAKEQMVEQILDSMELERERGITIKLNAVRLNYQPKNSTQKYQLNLIDTPGHVDFSYEVSRSLAACEGAILVIDATQGIQAQTISNLYLALENNLTIIPVINKIDLPSANTNYVLKQIKDQLGFSPDNIALISAKTGLNCEHVLESIIKNIPPASNNCEAPVQALIFDSYYDPFKGAVVFIRMKTGKLKKGDKILFMRRQQIYTIVNLGIKTPNLIPVEELSAGEVGFITAAIKELKDISVGDTITLVDNPCAKELPGYQQVLPMVYCGLYPINNQHQNQFKEAMQKIALSDASLTYEYESSLALGFGVRCGFLGLLHLEIIKERLAKEYFMDVIATTATVSYQIELTNNKILTIDNPADFPSCEKINKILEPFVNATILVPEQYVGKVMELCQEHRAIYQDLQLVEPDLRLLKYEMPLAEIIYNFYHDLKSISNGYAVFNYSFSKLKPSKLIKIDVLLNNQRIDALSFITDRQSSYYKSKNLVTKLKEHIPQHLFEVPIQAAINNKVIARETIKALKKNVTAKCYGGDITRKKKLWEQQKAGKKKMKSLGVVDVPHDLFLKILKK